jgi:tripartite-type tricarboxylate transporter receptor subunit TctC
MPLSARIVGFCLAVVFAQSASALADDYPSRPVRLVTTVEAGGMADATARYLSKQLSAQLKQPYVVENRPGISGIVAVERVSNAKADGYTLLYAADTLAIAPSLLPNLSVDIEKDITPVTLVGGAPFVFVVNPRIPVKTPNELVDYIKQHPGGFRWGIGGLGTPGQMAIERFSKLAGIHALEVPYKGTAPSVTAALSGEVDGTVGLYTAVKPLIDSGKLIALGVASAKPMDSMPGIPTIASFGYPGYEALSWFGIWGAKDMPAELAVQIRNQVAEALKSPELIQEFTRIGLTVTVSNSPSEFAAYFKSELDRDSEILKQLNLKH